MQLTNSREVATFFIARAIVVAVLFAASPVLLTPLYMELLRAGGAALMTVGTLSVSIVAWLVTLLLFVALRGGLGGVPPMVGSSDTVTSSSGEIGAYVIAVLIVIILVYGFNMVVLGPIYASLRQSGGTMWVMPLSLAVAAATAVVFFVIFIALRSGMSGTASAGGPIES